MKTLIKIAIIGFIGFKVLAFAAESGIEAVELAKMDRHATIDTIVSK